MIQTGALQALISTWRARGVSFSLVYIMEAHATDEWPILDTETTFTQHKTSRTGAELRSLRDSYPLLESVEGFGADTSI